MSYKYKLHKIHPDEYTCDLYVPCFHAHFSNYLRANCKTKPLVEARLRTLSLTICSIQQGWENLIQSQVLSNLCKLFQPYFCLF